MAYKKSTSIIKERGRIYTPKFIVRNILDIAKYNTNIIGKNIIDNSCGDGAFLIEIVKRYCDSFTKTYGKNNELLKSHLEKYIHGIEIEKSEIEKCKNNLDNQVKKIGLENVNWDLICADTLTINKFNHQMDFVVGNPPYVRVHNLTNNYNNVKKFKFSENGMTDLYIVFFEIGLDMLNKTGKMCLITPSSCLRSKAGINFRKYIANNKNLTKIVDLGHFQPFNATTYTMITLFEAHKKTNCLEYYAYDETNKKPRKIENLKYSDIFINGNIFISDKESLSMLHEISNYNFNIFGQISVKNGFATLSDNVFIGNFEESNLVINILKASTGKWHKCIFPYNKNSQPMTLSEIQTSSNSIYNYLLSHKEKLENRSLDNKDQWHLFGRTQAIKDVQKNKIAINTIIKDIDSIRIEFIPAGSGVYSGLYILSDYSVEEIEKVIKSDEFIKYLKLLKNYKSGGYYTFSSSELQKFLTYKLRKDNYEQQSIFANDRQFVY